MSLRHALLGALADHPRTGYELLKHFEQSFEKGFEGGFKALEKALDKAFKPKAQ